MPYRGGQLDLDVTLLTTIAMSSRRALNVTGKAALELLRMTAASADVFPPLRSVAEGVLHITDIVEVRCPLSYCDWLLTP